MIPRVRFGNTDLEVTRIGLGGFPFGGINEARDWNPFTPEGRRQAIATVHAALDAGINYVDTAPGYGQGNSESIIGEAIQARRDRIVLATKVGYQNLSPADVTASGGLLDALLELREQEKLRFVGFTVEEPWTGRPLVASGAFDVAQIRYDLIYQSAALHLLDETREAGMGVTVMRPMTSGILQRIATYLAPEWQQARDLYEVALKFVLADSRVHVPLVGMRWPAEVEKNVAIASSFTPPLDVANLPRLTAGIYRTEDEEDGE